MKYDSKKGMQYRAPRRYSYTARLLMVVFGTAFLLTLALGVALFGFLLCANFTLNDLPSLAVITAFVAGIVAAGLLYCVDELFKKLKPFDY